jgi:hypothetical protein
MLIASKFDILRYPNARQYKTVASALVKTYPFLESSTDGGEVSDIFCFDQKNRLSGYSRAHGLMVLKENLNVVAVRLHPMLMQPKHWVLKMVMIDCPVTKN